MEGTTQSRQSHTSLTCLTTSADHADICTEYQVELERKSDIHCLHKATLTDIQILAKDVHQLSEDVKKACLMKKWGSHSEDGKQQRELPEDQTYQLCTELMDDQDLSTDMVQNLRQQQSQVDSEVAKVMSELESYYAKS